MTFALAVALAVLYGLFIAHAALSGGGQLVGFDPAAVSWRAALSMPRHVSRADLVVNVLGYAPFGYLLAQVLVAARTRGAGGRQGLRFAWRIALGATFVAALVSAGTEVLQTVIPGRVSSAVDVAANAAGAMLGALARPAFHHAFDRSGRYSRPTFSVVAADALPRLAIAAVAVWLADRWWPMLFTLDVGAVRGALRPVRAWWQGQAPFAMEQFARYAALHLSALLLVGAALASRGARWLSIPAFAAVALAGKVLAGRSLRIEEITAVAAALSLALPLAVMPRRAALVVGAAASAMGFVVAQLTAGLGTFALPGSLDRFGQPFNWKPFAMTLAREDLGIAPFLGLGAHLAPGAYFAWRLMRPSLARALASGALVGLTVFALEWAQTRVAQRFGDVTLALVALLGWLALARAAAADRAAAPGPLPGASRRSAFREHPADALRAAAFAGPPDVPAQSAEGSR